MDAPNVEVRRELQPAVQLHLARAPGVDVEDLRKAGLVRVKQGPNLHARAVRCLRERQDICVKRTCFSCSSSGSIDWMLDRSLQPPVSW